MTTPNDTLYCKNTTGRADGSLFQIPHGRGEIIKKRLTETEWKREAIKEHFVAEEIGRILFEKFRPKYAKECFEIEQELGKTGGYKSNPKSKFLFFSNP